MVRYYGGVFMSNFDAVLFDFDGTIADTGEGVFFCIRKAIERFGLRQPTEAEIRKFIGPPMVVSYKTLYPQLGDDEVQKLLVSFREDYVKTGLYKFRLYDGITELLKKLSESGIKTAVASSKPQKELERIITYSGIDKYIGAIVGADINYKDSDKATIVEDAMKKLGVEDKSRVLMVGDRKYDIVGAHKVGIACAAVLFGYGSREEFEEYKADYVVESFEEVEKLVI